MRAFQNFINLAANITYYEILQNICLPFSDFSHVLEL